MPGRRRVRSLALQFRPACGSVLEFRKSFVSPYVDTAVDGSQAQLRPAATDDSFGSLSGKLATHGQLEIGFDRAVLGLGADASRGAARHLQRDGPIDGREIER